MTIWELYMKTLGTGSSLWLEWEGEGYEPDISGTTFYTLYHVNVSNETVKMALARAMQQFGFVDGLGEGLKALEDAEVEHGWAGKIDGDDEYTAVDMQGVTPGGESTEDYSPVTWVTVSDA